MRHVLLASLVLAAAPAIVQARPPRTECANGVCAAPGYTHSPATAAPVPLVHPAGRGAGVAAAPQAAPRLNGFRPFRPLLDRVRERRAR